MDAEEQRMLRKLYIDMYEGQGKDNPPITTRMAVMEENMDKINVNLTWLLRLGIGAVILAVLNLVLHTAK